MSPTDLLLPISPLSISLSLSLLLIPFLLLLLHPGGLAWSLACRSHSSTPTRAIPGPTGLPLLGLALVFTSSIPHRVFAALSATIAGSVSLMSFSVGMTRYIISSHPETAKEILSSPSFADRPIKESAYGLLFHRAMGFAPYGDYWRGLRRVSSTHLFSPKRVSAYSGIRAEIGAKMLKEVEIMMGRDGVVGVRKVLHLGSLNNVMRIVFGKMYEFDEKSEKGVELEGLVSEGYEILGAFNWADHFPVIGWFDLQGVRRRCKGLVERVNMFVGEIVEEHKVKRMKMMNEKMINNGDESEKDFVDVLLGLDGENKLSDSDMIAVLWEMIFRGTDTVAILLEWILARMVLHQDIQAKVRAEIDNVVGTNKQVSDSDLPHLPYLRAVVKETLRVHPPGPLLSWARLAVHDTHVGHHFIPAGTTAMVNMWAITHDEKIWADPDEFRPERFIEEDVSIMGSDLRLAPFGAGRRVCPGKALGLVTVQLWLAQMLQNFKWVAADVGVDLTECLKLSMEMKSSLVCKALPCRAA
ncbi:Cytochrome P450 78A5-like protein [Drosera capensis]